MADEESAQPGDGQLQPRRSIDERVSASHTQATKLISKRSRVSDLARSSRDLSRRSPSLDWVNQRNQGVVAAARGPNYQDPAVANHFNFQMNAILIVTGLIISGAYGGLNTSYTTVANHSDRSRHNWFALCNYVAFGFAVAAALLALSFLMASYRLLRWPPDWHELPVPPRSIVEHYIDRFDFETVSECAQALNFAWHACNYGHAPARYCWLLNLNVQASYCFLLSSMLISLAAAIIALTAQTAGPSSHKFTAAGVAITLAPPLLLQLLPWLLAGCSTLPAMLESMWPTSVAKMDIAVQSWRHSVEDAVQCSCKDDNKVLFHARVWYEAGKLVARKHSYLQPVSPAAGFQAEVEDEYSKEVAPIMAALAAWQQEHGPHYAVHVFMDPLLASQAVSKMQALHKFWHRWEAMVTAGTFTAEEFFSGSETDNGPVWLDRARRFRLLAEPLFIARWYYNNRHCRPTNPTPLAGASLYRSSRTSAAVQPVLASVSAASAATTAGSQNPSVARRVSRSMDQAAEEAASVLEQVAGLAGRKYRQRQYFSVIWEQEEREAARWGQGGQGHRQLQQWPPGDPQPSLELEFLLEHHLGAPNLTFQAMPAQLREATGLLKCRACEQGHNC